MKKVNYLFILLAILFSLFILFVSLQSANKNEMVGNSKLMSGKFYMSKEILPDHSMYPLLMIIDRVRLELADSEKRTYLLVSYANRRLFYSKKLLEKGNKILALTTVNKATKYINQALEESIILLEQSPNRKEEHKELAFFVLQNLDEHTKFFIDHKNQFSGEEKVVIESLSLQSSSLAEKLYRLIEVN